MESKLNSVISKIQSLENSLREMKKEVSEIHREVGTREGYELSRQVDDMYHTLKEQDSKLNIIQRDVTAIRKQIEFGDVDLKEIKKALALIYRNTDELEENLLQEDERET